MSARDAAAAAVATARTAVAAGVFVDLAGLDRLIGEACEEAKLAPKETRAAAAEELLGLVRELDGLALELASQQAAFRLAPVSPERASAAYKDRG